MLNTNVLNSSVDAHGRGAVTSLNVLAYVHLRNISNSTGAGRVARQLVEHLALRPDVNLHVLADARDRVRIVPLVCEPWPEFAYHTFASDTSRQQALWYAVGRPRAESYWPEAKIVFCTGESYVPVRKARLVVTLHDAAYFEEDGRAHKSSFRQQRIKWKLLFHRLSQKADIFHTVSNFSAERLAHFFPAMASRIRVVHNGVTPQFFAPVEHEGHEYLRTVGLADRPFVLIPGGLHFRKNADLILENVPALLRRFPDLILAVVNHSDPSYTARAATLGPNLRLLNFVSDPALHALYTAARVVWFPSLYEGFGLPVIEAMACGTPVVASNTSSIPEVAGSAAILADPDNGESHLEALDFLLTDQGARERLSVAGKARAAQFTWTSSASKMKQVFDALV